MASSSSAPSYSSPPNTDVGSKWSRWGRSAFDRSIRISDWASEYANAAGAKLGAQRFWPKSNDFPDEVRKCEQILRTFTVEGVVAKEHKEDEVRDAKGNVVKKKRRVLKKIPPSAVKRAKGICIYSSMRSGIAPFGGAGGTGLVLARLPDGSWSAPSCLSPNNVSAGLLLGVDFFDVVLLINSDAALESFKTHKFSLGAETSVAAGPMGGAGASLEAGLERSPVFSYMRSSAGLYAGFEFMGQVFAERFDENERVYHWPGVTGRDILEGRVRTPPLVSGLHRALRDAELGTAQGGKLELTVYDVVKVPESEVMRQLAPNHLGQRRVRKVPRRPPPSSSSLPPSPISPEHGEQAKTGGSVDGAAPADGGQPVGSSIAHGASADADSAARGSERAGGDGTGESASMAKGEAGDGVASQKLEVAPGEAEGEEVEVEDEEEDELVRDGERLRLPPTPAELEALEAAGIPDEEDVRLEQKEREAVYKLPPPPMHRDVSRYWRARPNRAQLRATYALIPEAQRYDEAQRRAMYVALPPSPVAKDAAALLVAPNEVPKLAADMASRLSVAEGVEAGERHGASGDRDEEGDEVRGERTVARGVDEREADALMEKAVADAEADVRAEAAAEGASATTRADHAVAAETASAAYSPPPIEAEPLSPDVSAADEKLGSEREGAAEKVPSAQENDDVGDRPGGATEDVSTQPSASATSAVVGVGTDVEGSGHQGAPAGAEGDRGGHGVHAAAISSVGPTSADEADAGARRGSSASLAPSRPPRSSARAGASAATTSTTTTTAAAVEAWTSQQEEAEVGVDEVHDADGRPSDEEGDGVEGGGEEKAGAQEAGQEEEEARRGDEAEVAKAAKQEDDDSPKAEASEGLGDVDQEATSASAAKEEDEAGDRHDVDEAKADVGGD